MKLFNRYLCWITLLYGTILIVHSVPINLMNAQPNNKKMDRRMDLIDTSKRLISQGRSFNTITAFVTDPALLVTILHSLEVAYWTLPFGFILSPIINLFRMPNKRSYIGGPFSAKKPKVRMNEAELKHFYQLLSKAVEKIEHLNRTHKRGQRLN
ncbi:hypothetical protein RDWZM_000882 [Blomia tropicalis]|uniref:Uncharacterized protein n=1 Tax=Blomia tropicalis TaxID=40697 RepID=A0A9Q0MB66_BLOTA|nr:hypothetical protein BLOT_015271 [Blomia tropicalis]KAJ6222337.1 hypothetical protein RDWZM_000882 [Blomia tropicalis]